MEFLAALWLPILVSAVAVFVVSSIFHMVIPIHKGDTHGLSNEEAVMETMRAGDVKPGEYLLPFCGDMKEMGSDEFKAKMARGPVAFMTVMPNGPLNFGTSLVQWFGYSILIGVLVAYVGKITLADGTAFPTVFRVLGTIAVLPYGVANLHDFIWKGKSMKVVSKFVFEGVIYGLVTGAVFAWMWPGV
ncbi:hypothetical protein DRQ53_05415 [bacterium]|nr:MAG: hypothetical protein DRQ32_02780 [bacterium]RKZ16765.1 MAG: hypothetical protein DRQ53_05415 [bacterium]